MQSAIGSGTIIINHQSISGFQDFYGTLLQMVGDHLSLVFRLMVDGQCSNYILSFCDHADD